MARINKYKLDENVTGTDLVIGSDAGTGRTRNYRLQDLASFFGTQDAVLGDKFSYKYVSEKQYSNLQPGELSFNNNFETALFENVTTIYANRINLAGNDIYAYFEALLDQNGTLTMHSSENSTFFGIYRVSSINIYYNDVISLGVILVASNGSTKDKDNINLSSVFSTGDKKYVHTQIQSVAVWNVDHFLGKYPSVTVVDDGNNVIVGDIKYINDNQLTITFNGAISGKAFIN